MAGKGNNKEGKKLEEAILKEGGGLPATINITKNFKCLALGMKLGYGIVSLEGGTRSGKTYAALQWIVLASLNPKKFLPEGWDENKLVTRCLRKEAANARDSIWKDLNEIMDTFGIKSGEQGFMCNKTTMTWTFPNGSEISCGGASDKDKLHGLKQDIVFFNEVMYIPKAAFEQVSYRTRVAFILDWNPSLNDHWVFRMGLDKTCNYGNNESPELRGKPRCLYVHSTYKDNFDLFTKKSNLTAKQISEIEKTEPTDFNIKQGTADRFQWDVYGLGKRGVLEGRIVPMEKVTIVDDEDFPTSSQWEMHGYGLDWGFNDPTALAECAIWNKMLYVRELIYEKNLVAAPDPLNPQQRSVLGILKGLGIARNQPIVADNARPEMILALRGAGYNVVAVEKIGGSVDNGIQLMNSRRWCVSDSSYNLKHELENYVWKRNRYGEEQNVPVDKYNHLMDAIRYWLTTYLSPSNDSRYSARDDDEGKEHEVEYGCSMPDYFM